MALERVSASRCFGGTQAVFAHDSFQTSSRMRFGVYLPPQAREARVPVMYWLSGLTCTEENFIAKAGAQRVASELGLALVVPDTSPRGVAIPGDSADWDFGVGAGFYVDATQPPWSAHYRMYSYVTEELRALVEAEFPVQAGRIALSGHSMGGHGALTIALRRPEWVASVSAFAPITAPMRCPWGEKAFGGYLGADRTAWAEHDATELLRSRGWSGPPILIDQGTSDPFLDSQLKPGLLETAANAAGVRLQLRLHDGYDHGYFFVSTFIEDHLRFHSRQLRGA
jgi:S-formylglutathione hydrolase